MLHPVYFLTHVFPLLILAAGLLRIFGWHGLARIIFAPFRFMKFFLIIALLSFGGCSHTEDLAKAKGPWFQLNPDHWQAVPGDLKDPPKTAR
jgi:hypothetical protein